MTDFGTQLRDLRVRIGLTQTDLAKASNLGQSTISALENGRASPTDAEMERIIHELGTPDFKSRISANLLERWLEKQQSFHPYSEPAVLAAPIPVPGNSPGSMRFAWIAKIPDGSITLEVDVSSDIWGRMKIMDIAIDGESAMESIAGIDQPPTDDASAGEE